MSQTIEIPIEFLEEIVDLQFPPPVQEQMARLMDKNTEGQLSEEEQRELQALVELNELVSIMKGRARLLLSRI